VRVHACAPTSARTACPTRGSRRLRSHLAQSTELSGQKTVTVWPQLAGFCPSRDRLRTASRSDTGLEHRSRTKKTRDMGSDHCVTGLWPERDQEPVMRVDDRMYLSVAAHADD
jgi:hypothetical protein